MGQDPGTAIASGVGLRQRQFGDYVIERELGRGGMGVVWLATQKSLGRQVALKVLPSFATMDIDAVQRFRREAEATGRIRHPGIVPVYGFGEVDGIHYFAMEFIDGLPLGTMLESLSMRQADKLRESLVDEARCAERYPGLREPPAIGAGNAYVRSCARLCAEVANSLAAAHAEGVIHRDLKPNNILIHPAGRPVLVDFGLARDERSTGLTRTGEQIGTPAYMAPEQARGHSDVDARADVYGLGAVLYELLSLRPPFEGGTTAQIVHRILTEDPRPVRRHNPLVPVDLAAIVHCCLAKDPAARYASIAAMELDLREFLAGQQVTARLPNALVRLHSRLQRNRRSLATSTGVALTTAIIAVLTGVVDDRNTVQLGYDRLAEAGRLLVEERDVERARAFYEQAVALTKAPEAVRAQRRRDFQAAFDRYYQDKPGGPDALRRFASVFGHDECVQLRDLLDRLAGRGWLELSSSTAKRTASLEVRRASGDGLAPEWQPLHSGELLPTGEYLVRVTDRDGAVAHLQARIEADVATTIAPRYLETGALPAGMVLVDDPQRGTASIAGRYEVTRTEWREWLASLADPDLAAEMQPLDWDEGAARPDAAVSGLSFHQARTHAAAQGGHLPTARELWLAGSAGLQGLAQPWGGAADPARLAADPLRLQATEPVHSRPEGQSPLGFFHVLGNAAEVLSAADGVLPRMGGGCFIDDPRQLCLLGATGTLPVAPLPGRLKGHVGAGQRLFRFLPPADDQQAIAAAQARRDELRAGAGSFVFHDWELQRDGLVRCELETSGRFDGRDRRISVPFETPGYLLRQGRLQALDGQRRPLPGSTVTAPGGESSWLFTELGADVAAGQSYRFFLSALLLPTDGLRPQADGYLLRLPMMRDGRLGQLYTLTLPAGCELLAEPMPPAAVSRQNGRTILSWEHATSSQIETAVVRFRCDGAFGSEFAVLRHVTERTQQFLAAWNDQSSRLAGMLDRDFVRQPHDLDRRAALARDDSEQLTLIEVVDAVRIGSVETVELLLDWQMRDRGGRTFTIERWPFVIQWQVAGDRPQVLRMQPRAVPDQGRFEAGAYVHDELRVRLDPVPDTVLSRTQTGLCELQVSLRRGGLTAQVMGLFAGDNEPAAQVRFRLTSGAEILGRGECLATTTDGGDSRQDWEFVHGDQLARERWLFLQRGRRYLLLRVAVTGRNPAALAATLDGDDARAWFAAIRNSLHIE